MSPVAAQHYLILDAHAEVNGVSTSPRTLIEVKPWGSLTVSGTVPVDDATKPTAIAIDRTANSRYFSFNRGFESGDVLFANSVAQVSNTAFQESMRISDFGIDERAKITALSFSDAGTHFSTDIPVTVGGQQVRAGDVLTITATGITRQLSLDQFGIPEGVKTTSMAALDGEFLLSFDRVFAIDGAIHRPNQVFLTDSSINSLAVQPTFSNISVTCERCRIVGLSFDDALSDVIFADDFR
jgi:hypothetical protein